MTRLQTRRVALPRIVLAVVLVVGTAHALVVAGEASPQDVTGLRVIPEAVVLRGPDAGQQLAVDGTSTTQDLRDLTSTALYESSDPRVAAVDERGWVTACGEGTARILVRSGRLTASVPVTVREFSVARSINFANEVVPIFTKLGCNAGGCHGKASGQNGFRLSLLGFEPALDYETLVKEGRGRRLFPPAPDASLLLVKATARVPHGGGRRLDPDSLEYRLIRRWIGLGMPLGKPTDPRVERISIYPPERVLSRGAAQQLVVTAHFTDGTHEDVTRWAQYLSNDPDVAAVENGGRVEARQAAGQAAIMARYQGLVAAFRATIPTGLAPGAATTFLAANRIDAAAFEQWKALGIIPSEPCTDAEFIRRAALDITGTLPTPAEIQAFLAETSWEKRGRLIDRLLDRPEYASFFATKWADILRNKREGKPDLQYATFAFHDWIRRRLAENTPYDRFVRGILAAQGSVEVAPPVHWYRKLKESSAFVDDTAQVFLGMRLQCAKCHHHPFEKWSQSDYYAFAAFFARVGRKPDLLGQRNGRDGDVIFTARSGTVTHPKTGEVMTPRGLGGDPIAIGVEEDPRQKLVDWMADPRNPYFAKALVNRYWAHFFGRGLVEPMDDFRSTNPPSNPALLAALAESFIKSGYDLKGLIRTITTSRVYGLSSAPNPSNAKDRQSFARHYPRRMSAEVLLDAIAQVTGAPTTFDGLPAGTRAIELPDESVGSTFLDTFGRPKRDTPCECERVSDATLGQSLMLLNSAEIQVKLSAPGSRAERLAQDPRPDAQKVEELFWAAFGRAPSQTETATALAHLAKHAANKRVAFEDILWALINAKEFQFID
ncbi:MAG TPA: DUF1549 domain-containing protein [Isosphaeraceae bacterium]|nr:DUF1549 domain-containing protein [Isosphaeraceae bacterium]